MATQQNQSLLQRIKQWMNDKLDVKTISTYISLSGFLYGPLDERLKIRDALQKALKKPVPSHINLFYCFGGLTFFFFLIQVVTGILLSIYYRPSPETAFQSVKYIMNDVYMGWLIRSLHRWGAEGMIVMVFLHMARVFFTGAYKKPREFNWIIGIALLSLTLMFGFTGYLLPWDQTAYFATRVGTEMPKFTPVIGDHILKILRGGDDVSGSTLSRFYSLHILVLPWIIFYFMVLHFMMIRKQGVAKPL